MYMLSPRGQHHHLSPLPSSYEQSLSLPGHRSAMWRRSPSPSVSPPEAPAMITQTSSVYRDSHPYPHPHPHPLAHAYSPAHSHPYPHAPPAHPYTLPHPPLPPRPPRRSISQRGPVSQSHSNIHTEEHSASPATTPPPSPPLPASLPSLPAAAAHEELMGRRIDRQSVRSGTPSISKPPLPIRPHSLAPASQPSSPAIQAPPQRSASPMLTTRKQPSTFQRRMSVPLGPLKRSKTNERVNEMFRSPATESKRRPLVAAPGGSTISSSSPYIRLPKKEKQKQPTLGNPELDELLSVDYVIVPRITPLDTDCRQEPHGVHDDSIIDTKPIIAAGSPSPASASPSPSASPCQSPYTSPSSLSIASKSPVSLLSNQLQQEILNALPSVPLDEKELFYTQAAKQPLQNTPTTAGIRPTPINPVYAIHEKLTTLQDILSILQANPIDEARASHIVSIALYQQSEFIAQNPNFFEAIPNLQSLSLQHCGIQSINTSRLLPNLLFLDLSYNNISDASLTSFSAFLSQTPALCCINLIGNPCCGSVDVNHLPPMESPIWSCVLLETADIRVINGLAIDNQHKWDAFNYHQQHTWKHQHRQKEHIQQQVAQSLWQHALLTYPITSVAIREQAGDDKSSVFITLCETLTELDLSRRALLTVDLSLFPALTRLNLSHNNLSSLEETYIHRCTQMKYLDLSHNQLRSTDTLYALTPLTCLVTIDLVSNPLSDYRMLLVFLSRNWFVSDAGQEALLIDGQRITFEERVSAIEAVGGGCGQQDQDKERWRWCCIEQCRQQRQPPATITQLQLNSQQLSYADLTPFPSLTYLSLHDNKLGEVIGLERCTKLQHVTLSGNPRLNQQRVLEQLGACEQLETIALASSPAGVTNAYVMAVLVHLLPNHSHLLSIDHYKLSVQDYTKAMRKVLGKQHEPLDNKDEQLIQYKLNAALMLEHAPKQDTTYDWKLVMNKTGYDVNTIPSISLFHHLGIQDGKQLQGLPIFPCVTYLNLSHNQLTTLLGIPWDKFPVLQYLDVSYNKLPLHTVDTVYFIRAHRSLRGIKLLGNPYPDHHSYAKFRQDVIETVFMDMLQGKIHLLIFDELISIEEKVLCWQRQRPQSDDPLLIEEQRRSSEAFRFSLIVDAHVADRDRHTITELNLEHCQLSLIQFAGFTNITKLILSHNSISTVGESGIDRCVHLRVLDLRYNLLSEMEDVLHVIFALVELVFIGLAGNRLSVNGNYRVSLLAGILSQQNSVNVLKYIDDKPISIDEVNAAVLAQPAERRKLLSSSHGVSTVLNNARQQQEAISQFYTALRERSISHTDTRVDISNCGLTFINFHGFDSIKDLDLSHNMLTLEALLNGNLTCRELKRLNVSLNQLQHTVQFAVFLQKFPHLSSLLAKGNLLFSRSEKSRIKFLSYFPNVHQPSFELVTIEDQPVTIEERVEALMERMKRMKQEGGQAGSKGATSPALVSTPPLLASIGSFSSFGPTGVAGGSPLIGAQVLVGPSSLPLRPNVSVDAVSSSPSMRLRKAVLGNKDSVLSAQDIQDAEHARFILAVTALHILPTDEFIQLSSQQVRWIGGTMSNGVFFQGISIFHSVVELNLEDNKLVTLEQQGLNTLPNLQTLNIRRNCIYSLSAVIDPLHSCPKLSRLFIQGATNNEETQTPTEYTGIVFEQLRGVTDCDSLPSPCSIHEDALTESAQQLIWKVSGQRIGPNHLHHVDISNQRLPKHLFFPILSALYHLGISRLQADGENEWALWSLYSDCCILFLGKRLRWLDGEVISEQRRYLCLNNGELTKLAEKRVLWEDCWQQAHETVDAYLVSRQQQVDQMDKHLQNKNEAEQNAIMAMGLGGGGFIQQDDNGEDGKPPNQRRSSINNAGMYPGMLTTATTTTGTSNTLNNSNLLSKVDIIIYYLQVFSLILAINLNIQFPVSFSAYTSWIKFFSLDLTGLFSFFTYQADMVLVIILGIPVLLAGLFWKLSLMRSQFELWENRYIHRWARTRVNLMFIYIVLQLIGVGAAIGIAAPNLSSGEGASSAQVSWGLVVVFVIPFLYFWFILVIGTFRWRWRIDCTREKEKTQAFWFNSINNAQVAILFGLTALYIPLSRIILEQYDCVDDATYAHPSQPCFPSYVSWAQILAFPAAVLFIGGIPVFYFILINRTVHLVVSTSRTYKFVNERIHQLQSLPFHQRREQAEELKALKIQRKRLYFVVVNQPQNNIPSTSLFAAYIYHWRFAKLIQMAQRLILVLLTLFTPNTIGIMSNAAIWLSMIVIALIVLWVCAARPYNLVIDDGLDILSNTGNLVNVLVALALVYEVAWMTQAVAAVLLFLANGIVLGAFLVAILLIPLYSWGKQRKLDKERREGLRKEEPKTEKPWDLQMLEEEELSKKELSDSQTLSVAAANPAELPTLASAAINGPSWTRTDLPLDEEKRREEQHQDLTEMAELENAQRLVSAEHVVVMDADEVQRADHVTVA